MKLIRSISLFIREQETPQQRGSETRWILLNNFFSPCTFTAIALQKISYSIHCKKSCAMTRFFNDFAFNLLSNLKIEL